MNIGFIGFGEAAYNISIGLAQEGISGIRATDIMMNHEVMGKQIHNRAKEAGVTLVNTNSEVARWADIIFVAVPVFSAMDVCNDIKENLRPSQLYVDVTSSTPANKEAVWRAIQSNGVLYVDAAMMGSLPKDKHQVPIIASGNGAEKFYEVMSPYGMKIKLVGENVGTASAIKLVRSIFMKGIAILMIDMLLTAYSYGVVEEVVDSVSRSMDGIPFNDHLNRLVTGTALHCTRRAAELKGSIALQEDVGLSPEMTLASMHRHEALAKYGFSTRYANTEPSGWQEIIETILGKD